MNLRASNEPCTDGTKDIRRVLAHRRMPFGADVYGERRDSERAKPSKLSAGLIGKTEPCTDGTKDIRRVLAHRRMAFGPDVYGERRDRERTKSSKLSAGLIGKTEPCAAGIVRPAAMAYYAFVMIV